jgi:arylsulfatase A-like enzyme/Flp pilus assembly protein TadD
MRKRTTANNWEVSRFFFFGLLGLSSVFAVQYRKTEAKRPDIYLITIDTLRADHIHCYGYDAIETPALDSLAAEGIRFTSAFTPAPITNVSHASILTGLQPSSHGVTSFGSPLLASHPTWAELVKPKSYQTAAFIGSIVLDSKTLAPGFDRGFDYYDNFPKASQLSPAKATTRWDRLERRGQEVVNHAEAWLSSHPAGPHFVWIHLYDPHDPYEPPWPFSIRYKDNLYDGEIAYADSALGNFLDFLKEKGLYQRAIIVVVGDHGEGLGDHNELTHGIFLYDSTTHVPLIIKLPAGAAAGKTIDSQVRTTDILPTVLQILNIPIPPSLDGTSLQPLFTGSESKERVVLGETDYPLLFGWAPLRSVRTAGTKYIEAPRPEFYDLLHDKGELHNLYEPWDKRVKNSRGILADAGMQPPRLPSSAKVGSDTLDELKALGYLGKADVGSSTTAPEPSLLPDPKDKIEEQNLLHAAMISDEEGRLSAAREAFEKTLQLDPDSLPALQQLGDLEFREQDFSKAYEYLSRAHQLGPRDPSIEFKLAEVLERQGNFTTARDALVDSLRYSPGEVNSRVLLGRIYLVLADNLKAADQFQAALLLEPKNLQAGLGLARAYLAMGNSSAALRELEDVRGTYSREPDIFGLLAQAFRQSGQLAKAAQAEREERLLRQKAAGSKQPPGF